MCFGGSPKAPPPPAAAPPPPAPPPEEQDIGSVRMREDEEQYGAGGAPNLRRPSQTGTKITGGSGTNI